MRTYTLQTREFGDWHDYSHHMSEDKAKAQYELDKLKFKPDEWRILEERIIPLKD